MSYQCRVDRQNPGALLFLLDQSASMDELMPGTKTSKARLVAQQINGLLFEIVQRCTKSIGEPPRPYFGVGVVGYGSDHRGVARVGSQFKGDLKDHLWVWSAELAQHPLRLETKEGSDGASPVRYPVWVDPYANGGTPMCAAFNTAGQMLKSWCDKYPDSFPPVVVNLTDGESTDGDPQVWADRLRSLRTNDGEALLFNLEIGSSGPPLAFSSAPPVGSDSAARLWNMSSELPPVMLDVAAAQGFAVDPGARGFACNADFRAVVSFLNVGTSIGQLLR